MFLTVFFKDACIVVALEDKNSVHLWDKWQAGLLPIIKDSGSLNSEVLY
jgi:hypothetical protein